MEIPLLSDLVVVLGLSVVVILVFQRLKLPTILGFLLTGTIAGPYGLSLIQATHEVEVLSEIGVVLLLFVIGMEFSLKSLMAIKKTVMVGGSAQVFLTVGLTMLVFYLLGYSIGESTFMGFLFSLSSTAIVLKLLQEKAEINAPHGRISLAILIYQDIIVVPMMLVTPMLAGQADNLGMELLKMVAKAGGVILIVVMAARYVVPKLLYLIVKTKSKELFVLAVVVLCFAVALLTSSVGLSLALGAFMAGLVISESEYSHQATSNILPFREIFTSIFFISIGMLLDLQFLVTNLHWVLLFAIIVMIGKGAIAALSALILRYPPRPVILTGLSLFQVGEFAFILSAVGISANLLSDTLYQYFLSVSIVTMAVTPFVFKYSEQLLHGISRAPIPQKLKNKISFQDKGGKEKSEELKDHLVIIGFGLNGHNVARAAKFAQIPYVILELNPDTVREERANGEPIYFGDASQEEVLKHVAIQHARVVVVAISDPVATKGIIAGIRDYSHKPHLIIRTRFVQEIEENLKLGADEVIPEEFETSIEIFTRVLTKYLVPKDEVAQFVNNIREDSYQMFRPMDENGQAVKPLRIPDIQITSLKVLGGNNEIIGKTLAECGLRMNYRITLLAIERDGTYLTDIDPDTRIKQGDIVFVFGKPDDIDRFNELLEA